MQKSIHRKLSWFVGVCLLMVSVFFVLKSMPATHAALRTLAGGSTQWDNSNFINQDFWNDNPSTGDIIMALYGSGDEGTAYTQNWSGYSAASCLNAGMSVIETNTLPQTLLANTIYVLDVAESIATGTINMASCSSVVSKYSSGTTFFSTEYIPGPLIKGYEKQSIIIDNIAIDGYHDGETGTHEPNIGGISLSNYQNFSINNISIHNHHIDIGTSYEYAGIILHNGNYGLLNNIQSFNNTAGIALNANCRYTSINNAHIYNNELYGIYFFYSDTNNNVINNSLIYNNKYGILNQQQGWNVINNTYIFNNTSYGIFYYYANSGIINNSYVYNNGIGIYGGLNQFAYGNNFIFNNNTDIGGGSPTIGNASDSIVAGLSWDDGTITTGKSMSRDYITNPINTSGNYLLSWFDGWYDIRDKKSNYYLTNTHEYSFGSEITIQQQPVTFSGSTLINSGTFDPSKYIGSDTIKVTGSLLGLPAMTSGLTFTVTGNALDGNISSYSLFGDIASWKINQPLGMSTGITLLTGDGNKRVVTQLFGNTYFATHFESDTFLDQTAPTFTFNGGGTYECLTTVALAITNVIDTGGISTTPYSFDNGITWSTTSTIAIPAQQPGAQIRTGRVRDALGNISYKTATFTFSNAPITTSNFTGSSNVLSSAKTTNWKTESHAQESWCGNTDIVFSGIVSQGTLGSCALSGTDFITYTPLPNQQGNDACTIQIKDNENSTANITIYRENIDTNISCLSNRNNDNFITGAFWDLAPTASNIVCALYGTGIGDTTAYTQNWSGRDTTQCNGANITVTETNNLPQTLATNTIYVLSGASSVTTGATNMASCSAVISRNTSGTTFFTTGYLNGGVFTLSNKQHGILDNIRINGNDDGVGGTHNKNNYGVYGLSASKNITLNNLDIYNNLYGIYTNTLSYTTIANSRLYTNTNNGVFAQSTTNSILQNVSAHDNNVGLQMSSASNNNLLINTTTNNNTTHGIYIILASNNIIDHNISYKNDNGILIETASNNTIKNSEIYNNNYGIRISDSSTNNSVNNSQIYNNIYMGIRIYASFNNTINNNRLCNNYSSVYLQDAHHNTINNTQVYNSKYGFYMTINSSNNIVHNTQIYNSKYGFNITLESSNNIIHNIQSYNNNESILLDSGSSIIFYETAKFFGNTTFISGSGENLFTGYTNDPLISLLGRSTGELTTTGTMSWNYITNPLNTSGNYLLSWSGSRNNLIGQQTGYITSVVDRRSYGSGSLLQAQPVIWSGSTNLIASGTFDPTKYIGSDTIKATGSLLGLPAMTSGLIFTVIGNASEGNILKYSLFGDIASWKTNQPLGTSTGITLLTGDGNKRVITQLFGNTYFATHFESDSLLDQTAPTKVSLISPLSGTVFSVGNTALVRSAAIDSGVGISGYMFEGINASGNVAIGGFTTNTGVTLSLPDNALYSRKVYAIDNVGNTGAWSNTWNFTVDTLVCSTLWNNDQFITDAFWTSNPANKCVIEALYGSPTDTSTAYTQNWSGYTSTACLSGNMNVIYTGNLSINHLAANTIYVLTGNVSTGDSAIQIGNCSTIISNINTGTMFLSTQTLLNGLFYGDNKQYAILDNLSINGGSGGIVSNHGYNQVGIYLYSGSKNITLYKTKISNNSLFGIYLYYTSNNIIIDGANISNSNAGITIKSGSNYSIKNSQIYDNQLGVYFQNTINSSINNSKTYNNISRGLYFSGVMNNTIIDSQIYNNKGEGVLLEYSNNNIFDNNQIYNNKYTGIAFSSGSNNNSISNTQVFNNSANNYAGIYFFSGTNNIINNCQVYNNTYGIAIATTGNYMYNSIIYNNTYGIWLGSNGKISFYGNNKNFANINNIYGSGENLFTGYASDTLVQSLGRSNGALITTGTMSRDYITNPINMAGNYLLAWSGSWASIRGYISAYSGGVTDKYSFGSGIFLQTQPVIYSGTTLINSGAFDPTKYIGSDTINVPGSLLGLPAMTSGLIFTVTGNASEGNILKYSLFGDIASWKPNQPLGTSTGILLLTGDGNKRVVTQLFGNSYFATHFENDTFLDQTTPTFTFSNATGLESSTGLLTITNAADTGVGLSLTPYSWSTDGITRGPWTANASTGLMLQHETTSTTLRVRVRDLVDNIRTGTATFTRTNTGPINTTLINNGPTVQNTIITRSGAALDTGTTLSYRWYSGYDCSSHFLSSGNNNTLTGLLSLPGTLVRSLKVVDIQGSGGACVTSTGTRSNIAPLATTVAVAGNEFTSLTLTGNAVGNAPLTYVWYSNTLCTSFLSTGQTYTPGVQNEPTTSNYYYTAADTFGGVSACTTGTITWNNVAPLAYNLYQTGNQSDELSFTAYGNDAGGTIFSYQRFSGDSCGGSVISTASTFSYTSVTPTIHTRSYKVFDAQGSGSNCALVTGIWNDTIAPTATIIYSPTSGLRTSGAVLASITGFSEAIIGLNTTGFIFTNNGTFTFTFSDLAGNTGSAIATVHWIDTTPPNQLVLVTPTSGSIFTTGDIELVRDAGVDTGSEISGYIFEIQGSGYFSTGKTYTTGFNSSGLVDGRYTRKIYTYDTVGNISTESDTWEFVVMTALPCTLPRGGTINDGQSIAAYQANTVACGATCVSQTRTCTHGVLSGSFTQASCTVNSCGGGGGGGTTIQQDDCTLSSILACSNSARIDASPSYYDASCCGLQTGHAAGGSCDVSDSLYPQEITHAFSRGYNLNITNKCPINTANLDNNITRIEAAKMISMFTIQALGIYPDTKKTGCDNYDDTASLSREMKFFAKTACQLNLMGLEPNGKTPKTSFDPQDFIDRAQFGTILSRLIYRDTYNIHSGEQSKKTWYEKHLQALSNDRIINQTTTPFALEKRARVLLMLKRTYDNKFANYRVSSPSQNIALPFIVNIW